MAERRNKLDIVFDILNSIQNKRGSIKPTHLLYKSNLSHDGMKRYLGELKNSEMVSESQDDKTGKKMIHLTDKGYKFLEEYSRMKDFTESFGL